MSPEDVDNLRCPGGGKIAYPTREAAKEVLRRMRQWHERQGHPLGQTMHVYECPTCRMWHLGRDRWNRNDNRKEKTQ